MQQMWHCERKIVSCSKRCTATVMSVNMTYRDGDMVRM